MTTYVSGRPSGHAIRERCGSLVARLLARARIMRQRAELRRILRQLDSRTLRDIGITGADVDAELARSSRLGL